MGLGLRVSMKNTHTIQITIEFWSSGLGDWKFEDFVSRL